MFQYIVSASKKEETRASSSVANPVFKYEGKLQLFEILSL